MACPAGAAAGVVDGAGVGRLGAADGVGVAVRVSDGVGVTVPVPVADGVGVTVPVPVAEGVGDGLPVDARDGVGDGLAVGAGGVDRAGVGCAAWLGRGDGWCAGAVLRVAAGLPASYR